MVDAPIERRHKPRQQLQQQPEQHELFPHRTGVADAPHGGESARVLWRKVIEAQARKQSGKL